MGIRFETTECTRCLGSGTYSYNAMHGRVCFKCKGRKTILTANGARAREFYMDNVTAVRRARASMVEVGDLVRVTWDYLGTLYTGHRRITSVTAHESGRIVFGFKANDCERETSMFPDAIISRKQPEYEEQIAKETVKRFKGATMEES